MMKFKSKKFVAFCCAVALVLTCSMSAFAAETTDATSNTLAKSVGFTTSQPGAVEDKDVEYHPFPDSTVPNVILSSLTRSLSVPTQFYDLNADSYYADLEYVGPNWLYTNRYFSPNSSGIINVGYSFDSITGRDVSLVIGLYNMNTKKMEVTWSSDFASHDSSSMHFYNLNTNYHYAIAFTSSDSSSTTTDPLTGNATIFH